MRVTTRAAAALLCAALAGGTAPASAQAPPDARVAAQRAAMAPLAWMDGRWRGAATSLGRAGKVDMTQTERVGPMLDGSVKVVEGKALDGSGRPNGFNALGVITYDPDRKSYTFHTFAQGYALDAPLTVTADGWSWEQPQGPGRTVRFSARREAGKWIETGLMTGPGAPPAGLTLFHMELERVGDTDWPAAGGAGAGR